MNNQRRRIWIDGFQTRLYVRLLAYCLIYQVGVWLLPMFLQRLSALMQAVTGQQLLWDGWAAPVVGLLLLAPLITLDAVRFAHRLVGPLHRLRKTIQALADGEPVGLLHLRQGDFLHDLKDDFNRLLLAWEAKGVIELESSGGAAQSSEVVAA